MQIGEHLAETASIVGLILTVSALVLTLIQLRSASLQVKELSEIRRSLSTRYIGQFPDYIPDVVSLIQSANEQVLIAYGQITFGLFSYREKWLEYRTALEQKLQDEIKVDLLCLDEKERKTHQIEQFSLDTISWQEKLNDPQFKDRLKIFAKCYLPKGEESLDCRTFLDLLERAQKKALEDEFKTATITEVGYPFAMHFSIVDRTRAIFTVPNFAEGPSELGFSTSDMRLIKALESMHARYKNRQIHIQSTQARDS